MITIRESSQLEYAEWYLERDARKGDGAFARNGLLDSVTRMKGEHPGKWRSWFDHIARWRVVQIAEAAELGRLVFLESAWTLDEGLVIPGIENYRLLDRVAANAIKARYLERDSATRHRSYSEQLLSGDLELTGNERIAICSAEPGELASNPDAEYYLLDGVGRCLPYMMLLQTGKLPYTPVEAFVADRCEVNRPASG